MDSIKFKFTIFVVVAIALVVLIFSGIIYSANLAVQDLQVTASILEQLAQNHPNLIRFIQVTGDPSSLIELSQLVSANAAIEANRRLAASVPLILILAAVVGLIVAWILVKPIEELSRHISELGSKNLSKRLPVIQSSSEIEALTTRINMLLDELEEAFKVQEQFVGDAAHELRTPLAAIKSQIEVNRNSKPGAEFIETIERLNNQMISLNEKLLYLNRSHAKKELEKVDVIRVSEDVVEVMQPIANKAKVKLHFHSESKKLMVRVDPSDLALVLKNLLENSIKYKAKVKPKVDIKLWADQGKVYFEIVDNGIGIPSGELAKIFDRFYRATNAVKVSSAGEGLGLAIVQKVIKAYGGSIEVSSKVGQGTTITTGFPL